MISEPPAIVQPAETEDAAFRREMREFMRHVRGELKDLKATVDLLLAAKELDDG